MQTVYNNNITKLPKKNTVFKKPLIFFIKNLFFSTLVRKSRKNTLITINYCTYVSENKTIGIKTEHYI